MLNISILRCGNIKIRYQKLRGGGTKVYFRSSRSPPVPPRLLRLWLPQQISCIKHPVQVDSLLPAQPLPKWHNPPDLNPGCGVTSAYISWFILHKVHLRFDTQFDTHRTRWTCRRTPCYHRHITWCLVETREPRQLMWPVAVSVCLLAALEKLSMVFSALRLIQVISQIQILDQIIGLPCWGLLWQQHALYLSVLVFF